MGGPLTWRCSGRRPWRRAMWDGKWGLLEERRWGLFLRTPPRGSAGPSSSPQPAGRVGGLGLHVERADAGAPFSLEVASRSLQRHQVGDMGGGSHCPTCAPRDLLGQEPQEKLEIRLCPDGSGQLYVPGLTEFQVQSVEDINKVWGWGTGGGEMWGDPTQSWAALAQPCPTPLGASVPSSVQCRG